jgi:hypothetical protein
MCSFSYVYLLHRITVIQVADTKPGSYRGAGRPAHFWFHTSLIWKCPCFWTEQVRGRIYDDDNELNLPGPSITRVPSKVVGGDVTMSSKCPKILQIKKWQKPYAGFPKFDNGSKNLHDIYNNEKMIKNFLHSQKQKPNFDQPCYRKDWTILLFSPQKLILQNGSHMKMRSNSMHPKKRRRKNKHYIGVVS